MHLSNFFVFLKSSYCLKLQKLLHIRKVIVHIFVKHRDSNLVLSVALICICASSLFPPLHPRHLHLRGSPIGVELVCQTCAWKLKHLDCICRHRSSYFVDGALRDDATTMKVHIKSLYKVKGKTLWLANAFSEPDVLLSRSR